MKRKYNREILLYFKAYFINLRADRIEYEAHKNEKFSHVQEETVEKLEGKPFLSGMDSSRFL